MIAIIFHLGVPLLYINYNCIVMEKPSLACTKKAAEVMKENNCSLKKLTFLIDMSQILVNCSN